MADPRRAWAPLPESRTRFESGNVPRRRPRRRDFYDLVEPHVASRYQGRARMTMGATPAYASTRPGHGGPDSESVVSDVSSDFGPRTALRPPSHDPIRWYDRKDEPQPIPSHSPRVFHPPTTGPGATSPPRPPPFAQTAPPQTWPIPSRHQPQQPQQRPFGSGLSTMHQGPHPSSSSSSSSPQHQKHKHNLTYSASLDRQIRRKRHQEKRTRFENARRDQAEQEQNEAYWRMYAQREAQQRPSLRQTGIFFAPGVAIGGTSQSTAASHNTNRPLAPRGAIQYAEPDAIRRKLERWEKARSLRESLEMQIRQKEERKRREEEERLAWDAREEARIARDLDQEQEQEQQQEPPPKTPPPEPILIDDDYDDQFAPPPPPPLPPPPPPPPQQPPQQQDQLTAQLQMAHWHHFMSDFRSSMKVIAQLQMMRSLGQVGRETSRELSTFVHASMRQHADYLASENAKLKGITKKMRSKMRRQMGQLRKAQKEAHYVVRYVKERSGDADQNADRYPVLQEVVKKKQEYGSAVLPPRPQCENESEILMADYVIGGMRGRSKRNRRRSDFDDDTESTISIATTASSMLDDSSSVFSDVTMPGKSRMLHPVISRIPRRRERERARRKQKDNRRSTGPRRRRRKSQNGSSSSLDEKLNRLDFALSQDSDNLRGKLVQKYFE